MILKLIKAFGVLVLLAATVTTADAILNDSQKCDKAKSTAAGKLFVAVIQCANLFDEGILDINGLQQCEQKAEDTCVAAFDNADATFGANCTFTANGSSVCDETLNDAIIIQSES